MDKNKLIYFFVFLFMVSIVSSAPPFQTNTITFQNGLQIETPIFDVVPVSSNYTFYFHVYDMNGSIKTNSSTKCILHIYYFVTGSHIFQKNASMDENGIDFEVEINSSLLTKEGNYFRLIQCNASNVGGFIGTQFKVGYSMREASVQDAIINSVMIFILVIFFIVTLAWAMMVDGENKFTMGPEGDTFLEMNIGKYVKLFLYLLSYLWFWMLTWAVWQVAEKFILSQTFSGVMHTLFIFETIMWIPLIIIVVVIGFIKHLTDSEVARLVKRGLKPR
jgi:hypothetical protein